VSRLFNSTKYYPTDCKTIEDVPNWINANIKTLKGKCQIVDGKLISSDVDVKFAFDNLDKHLQVDQKL